VPTTDLHGRDGLRLTADEVGPPDGPTAVLIHGGGQTRHAWGTTLRAIGERGWHAFSVDMRGHGDSDWDPDGDYTIEAFAGDVEAIGRSLADSPGGPPVLIGASLGGLSSLLAIGEADDPERIARGLVMVDVAARVESTGTDRIGNFMHSGLDGFDSLEDVADAIAAYNPHRPRPASLDGLKKNLRKRDGRWYWHWDPAFLTGKFGSRDETRSMVRHDPLAAAARNIRVPFLLVRGRMSDLLSEDGAREMLALVPHARFADVAGAGHMVAGDRNDAFNDAVLGFLDSLR
jgi:pimeloyl-ACP methyl ester carboxylesterase